MAGYSSTPLYRKLGLREGQCVRLIGQPDELKSWLAGAPEYQVVSRAPYDLVLLFENSITALENHLHKLRDQISPDGMVWVCWYKKASKTNRDHRRYYPGYGVPPAICGCKGLRNFR